MTKSVGRWRDSEHSVSQLRALLWIRLQAALGVEPIVTRSVRTCVGLADDLVAAGLACVHLEGKQGLVKQAWHTMSRRFGDKGEEPRPPETLADLAEPVLAKLVDELPAADQTGLAAEIVAELDDDMRRELLRRTAEKDIDRAVLKLAAEAGGLGSFAVAVGAAGFAPYLLAAKASAFIPLVSGPALVSLVSVLANPLFVIPVVVVAGWSVTRSADRRAAAQVALHLIVLLACDGLRRDRSSIEQLVASFGTLPSLDDDGSLRKEVALCRATFEDLEENSWFRAGGARPVVSNDWEGYDVGRNTVAIGAVSLADIVYSLAVIDPHVVAAADFASKEEIGSAFDFALHLEGKFGDTWAARAGDVARLKGYAMEQLAASKLAADGHAVELAEAPNQPGWDLLVDGEPFQVKCADADHIREHFEKYPDIPVLASSDLIDEQWPEEWADKVFFLDGLSNEFVEEITQRSYRAAEDLAGNDVPEVALAVVAARQAWMLGKGQVTVGQAASQLVLEGSTRAGLAVVGGVVGQAVGLLILGPAGGLVAGALGPVAAQAGARRVAAFAEGVVRRGKDRQHRQKFDALLSDVIQSIENAIELKLMAYRRKYREVGLGKAGLYVRHRLLDEARHLEENSALLHRLRTDDGKPEARTRELLRVATRTVHAACYQEPLRGLFRHLATKR
ncbi:MAG: hypothetical protein F4Y86_15530 [Gammaproteobacteria bacterium]|nr:hypothetical protein [Gammaproteobacteria bacterium]